MTTKHLTGPQAATTALARAVRLGTDDDVALARENLATAKAVAVIVGSDLTRDQQRRVVAAVRRDIEAAR